MSWINAPCCEACWIDREGTWEEVPGQPGVATLTGLRVPVRLVNPDPDGEFRIEQCHFCDLPTFSGIFVRTEV